MSFSIIPRNKINLYPGQIMDALRFLISEKLYRSNQKNHIKKFENNFKEYIGTRHALSLSSGTHALCIILKSLDIKAGDEVILASYNAPLILDVLQIFHIKPVFVDVLDTSYTINPALIEAKITGRTSAIIATHIEGFVCRMGEIRDIAKKHNLVVIEDCAHAAGSEYKNRKVGSIGDFGLFSMGFMKQLNAFGGGVITTNNSQYYEKMLEQQRKFLRPNANANIKKLITAVLYYSFLNTFMFHLFVYPVLLAYAALGKDPIYSSFERKKSAGKHPEVFLLSDMQAGIALRQLMRLDKLNCIRSEKLARLSCILSKRFKIQSSEKNTWQAYLNFCFQSKHLQRLKKRLIFSGIDLQRSWMHNCDVTRKSPVAEKLQKEALYISLNLSNKEIGYIQKVMQSKTFLRGVWKRRACAIRTARGRRIGETENIIY